MYWTCERSSWGEVGATQVAIRVLATAVNHLDLELRSGASRMPLAFPHVLGREVVGEVIEAGPAVTTRQVGDRVLVLPNAPCGRCVLCMSGRSNLCRSNFMPGITGWGGYAKHIRVDERALLPAPDVEPAVVAATPISFGTAWRMLYTVAQLKPGEIVLVAGAAGGLGHAVVQVAKLGGARVIGLVSDLTKADFVRRCGADEVLAAGEDWPAAVRDLTAGHGVDVVVEHIGGSMFEKALTVVALSGRIVVGGGHGGEHPRLDLIDVFRGEFQLLGSRSQRPDEIQSVLSLLADRKIHPVVDRTLPLTQAALAHELVASRQVMGKLVLVP